MGKLACRRSGRGQAVALTEEEGQNSNHPDVVHSISKEPEYDITQSCR